ncbi:MAG: DUF1553 domain-containing protein [Verrucomicrobiales bacterium]|nr:DUF1553 domain-containing protein [Verrucomicrobiales bacterium]
MRSLAGFSIPALLVSLTLASRGDELRIHAGGVTGTNHLVLRGQEARAQLLATRVTSDGRELDRARQVTWMVQPESIARVEDSQRLLGLADGDGVVTASTDDGLSATFPFTVSGATTSEPVNFVNQIVPILTKSGCNGGGCHGKAAGQNGFRLSLLGFEPGEDYEHLVKEARGRRLFPAAPERSLLLTKGTAELPHGGGRRLEPGSDDYRLIVRWIRQGMPLGRPSDPTVSRIVVVPTERTLERGKPQQLAVTAIYTDGHSEDVTRGALYEANDKDLVDPDINGLLTVRDLPGEVAVMVRYQGKVTTFRGTIPLGAPVNELPTARNFVDEWVFRQLRKVGMPPSGTSDDTTFLRRVTIDIAGRLPTESEAAEFLEAARESGEPESSGSSPVVMTAKRQKARDAVIDRLLASGDYADYFAGKWSALLRNKRTEARHTRGTYVFHDWIRDNLQQNRPYDEWVRELLTAAGDMTENPPVAWYRQVRTMQGQLEDISQLFLGQRLQCAQCHHHPYEKWSQADYWSFGAFFSQVSYKPGGQPGEDAVVHRRGKAQTTNKKNGMQVPPTALGAAPANLGPDDDPRAVLADWMTGPDNPYLARALVNRYWKHFFGRGLVEPEDDMRETNPASHPELLNALADHFVKSGFDLKQLARTLTQSATYQRTAVPNDANGKDKQHFSRYYPRRLPAEVLYDAVQALLLSPSKFDGLPEGTRAIALPDNSFNASSYFLTVFGRPESSSACECERSADASLSQSLHLLNAKDIQERLAADGSRAAKLATDSSRSDEAKLREVYLVAYGRPPSAEEVRVATEYLTKKSQTSTDANQRAKALREAWEDTVWAVINSKEFLFNH